MNVPYFNNLAAALYRVSAQIRKNKTSLRPSC
jgi:hypothetical protein